MKLNILLGISLLFTGGIGHAALPPAWESVREIQAILDAPHLNQYLESGDIIEGIEKIEKGWTIKTNHGHIEVIIDPLPQTMPGPMKFQLKFSRFESDSRPH